MLGYNSYNPSIYQVYPSSMFSYACLSMGHIWKFCPYVSFSLSIFINKKRMSWLISGPLEQGAEGTIAPTFDKISPKFLQNRVFCLKFLLFALPLVGKLQQPWICDIPLQTEPLSNIANFFAAFLKKWKRKTYLKGTFLQHYVYSALKSCCTSALPRRLH